MMATEEQEVQINGEVHLDQFEGVESSQTQYDNTAVSIERSFVESPSPVAKSNTEDVKSIFSSESIILKAELNGDIRRTYLNNAELTYDDLVRRLERLFKQLKASDNVVIKYKDEEGDFVTIESNDELSFAIQTCKGLNLKISRKEISTEKTLASELKQELLEIRNQIDKMVKQLEIGGLDNDMAPQKRSERTSYNIPVKEFADVPKPVTPASRVTTPLMKAGELGATVSNLQNKGPSVSDVFQSTAVTPGSQILTGVAQVLPPPSAPVIDQVGGKPQASYNFTPAMGLPATYPGVPVAPASETASPAGQVAPVAQNLGQQVPYSGSSTPYYTGNFSTQPQPAPYPSMGQPNCNNNLNMTSPRGYSAMTLPSGTQTAAYPGGQMQPHQALPDTGLYSTGASNQQQQQQQQPTMNQGPPPIRAPAPLPPPPFANVSAGGAFNPYARTAHPPPRSGLQ